MKHNQQHMNRKFWRYFTKINIVLLVMIFSGCIFESDKNREVANIGLETNQNLDSLKGVGPVVLFEDKIWIGNRTKEKQGIYVYDLRKDSVVSYVETSSLPPNSMGIAEKEYLVIANSDYKDGSLSSINIFSGVIEKDYKTIDQDNAISISDNKSFLLERTKNVISGFKNGILSTDNTFLNINIGNGANPYGVGVISDTKAYIIRYGKPSLLIVNPSVLDGGNRDSISLEKYVANYGTDTASGTPNMSSITIYGKYAFVSLQRLTGFKALEISKVVVIDTEKDTIVKTIDMNLKNPISSFVRGKYWYLSCADYVGNQGGVERINLDEMVTAGVVVKQSTVGGNISKFIAVNDSEGFVVVSKQWPTSVIQRVNF